MTTSFKGEEGNGIFQRIALKDNHNNFILCRAKCLCGGKYGPML